MPSMLMLCVKTCSAACFVILIQISNSVLQVFKPTMPFSAAYLAANSAFHFSPTANCFIATFVFMVAMSQQFHAWGHMKKSDLPAAVLALQVSTCSMIPDHQCV